MRFPIQCTRGDVGARRAPRSCRMLGATCEYRGRKPITSSGSRNSEAGAAVSVVVPLVGFTGAPGGWGESGKAELTTVSGRRPSA